MTPAHHLERSRNYLDYVSPDIAAGQYARAARALARSASHAVTAAAVHWHHRHHSRRRLNSLLGELVYDRRIGYTHLATFTEVYQVVDHMDDATPETARRTLRRLRRRVSRLHAAVAAAMALEPKPPTLEEVLAGLIAKPEPDPTPEISTIGELKDALGQYVDTEYRNHPIDCNGCRIGYHDPTPVRTV